MLITVKLPNLNENLEFHSYSAWCQENVGPNRYDIPFYKRYFVKNTWMWHSLEGRAAIAFYNEDDALAFRLRFGV